MRDTVKTSKDLCNFEFNKKERSDYADFNCHWCRATHIGMHSHADYYEIVIATDTDLTNKINTVNHLQRVKDIVILKPGISHGLYGIGNQRPIHYNIAVKASYFDSLIRNKESLKKHFSENPYLTVHPDNTTFRYLRLQIDKIDNRKYDVWGTTLLETILHVILLDAMDHLKGQENEDERISYYCRDALMKIDKFAFISKSAADIYKCYPVSHTSFIAEFKRLCGVPPSQYLAEKKMEYAKTLLLTTNLSILQISDELRYSSVSYFIKKFKAMYGQSPLQYRKDNEGEVLSIKE